MENNQDKLRTKQTGETSGTKDQRNYQHLCRQNSQLQPENRNLSYQLRASRQELARIKVSYNRTQSDLEQIQRVLDRSNRFFERMDVQTA